MSDVPDVRFVVVPGWMGSDLGHWQSRWQEQWGHLAIRFAPASWEEPDPVGWYAALDTAIRAFPAERVVLIAHSVGVLTVSAWLGEHPAGVAAAFLVAPPDPFSSPFTDVAGSWPVPAGPLGVPTTLVASRDDPYSRLEAAQLLAQRWGAEFVDAGALGHINSQSGIGDWPEGQAHLSALLRRIPPGV